MTVWVWTTILVSVSYWVSAITAGNCKNKQVSRRREKRIKIDWATCGDRDRRSINGKRDRTAKRGQGPTKEGIVRTRQGVPPSSQSSKRRWGGVGTLVFRFATAGS